MFNEGPKKEFGGLGELVIVDIHILHSFPLGIKSINRLKKTLFNPAYVEQESQAKMPESIRIVKTLVI